MFLLTLGLSSTVLAGPFGLEMGMTLENISSKGVDVPNHPNNMFYADSVPNRTAINFDSYIYIVSKVAGLVSCGAKKDDMSYYEFKDVTDILVRQLTREYGEPTKRPSRYTTSWNGKDWLFFPAGSDVVIIGLKVYYSAETDKYDVLLKYQFKNYKQYMMNGEK